jgi:methylated-DNA-[protein]-cysteine S-methyltransferase
MDSVFVNSFETRLGTFHTAASSEKLVAVGLPGRRAEAFRRDLTVAGYTPTENGTSALNDEAERQIRDYLKGRLRRFTLPLALTGTPFQKAALEQVARIPYGETMTYGQIARVLGRPGAARAVGAANARNPLPIVIPCHRVVAAQGLGGYGGGLDMKRELLELEGSPDGH